MVGGAPPGHGGGARGAGSGELEGGSDFRHHDRGSAVGCGSHVRGCIQGDARAPAEAAGPDARGTQPLGREITAMAGMNMIQALNSAMDIMLMRDLSVVIMGEDVG